MTTPAFTIRTNNQPHQLLNFSQLTEKERKEYDYAPDDENNFKDFFRYQGVCYCLSDEAVLINDKHLKSQGWEAIISLGAFAAVLIKFVPHNRDQIIIGMLLG